MIFSRHVSVCPSRPLGTRADRQEQSITAPVEGSSLTLSNTEPHVNVT